MVFVRAVRQAFSLIIFSIGQHPHIPSRITAASTASRQAKVSIERGVMMINL
jgi:hypothetical protein